MSLPACPVPTHADWKKLRDKAGGKSGLSKVNMGKRLDEFHGVLKADDVTKARTVCVVLRTAAKTYSQEVAKKYPKLAAAVNTDILGKLSAFEDAMDNMGKTADTKPVDSAKNTVPVDSEKDMKDGLDTILKTTAKTLPALKTLGDQLAVANEHRLGGTPEQKEAVIVAVPAQRQRLDQIEAACAPSRAAGQRIARHDGSVRTKFQPQYDKALQELTLQESQIKSLRTALIPLSGKKL